MDGGIEGEAVEKRGEDWRGGRMGEREVEWVVWAVEVVPCTN